MLIGYAYFFYFIFVQFMQFPVLDFGLDHYVSEPFIIMESRPYIAISWSSLPNHRKLPSVLAMRLITVITHRQKFCLLAS